MPFPFAALMGLSSAVGAMGTLAAGQAQKSAAELKNLSRIFQRVTARIVLMRRGAVIAFQIVFQGQFPVRGNRIRGFMSDLQIFKVKRL